MTTILVFTEKHGRRRYFDASTESAAFAAALKVARERNAEKRYEGADGSRASRAIDANDGAAALEILRRRSHRGYEYERMDMVFLESAE